MKECSKCATVKLLEDFNKCSSSKDGRQYQCRECERAYRLANKDKIKQRVAIYIRENKEIRTEKMREWRTKNPEKARETARAWRNKNREKERIQKKEYYENNKEKIQAYAKEWGEKNKEKMTEYRREYMREYRKTNPNYAIRHRMSNRLRELIYNGKNGHKTVDFIGCSIDFLKSHLESLFSPEMSWERFLNGEIHIDHIRPCCSFDLTDPEQQRKCFHYTNLQPLWAVDNWKKRSEDLKLKMDKNRVSNE